MKVFVIGGSGYVAGLTLPTLAQHHDLHLFDLEPPKVPQLAHMAFTQGDASDATALRDAISEHDVLLYMAMGAPRWQDDTAITTAFDANVKAVYIALNAAAQAGIAHAVYTSSMSIYDGNLAMRYFADEEITPDARHFYGLTKRFGEEVCRNATRQWNMSINALRLCLPVPEESWLVHTVAGEPTISTAADDVARALLASLDYQGNGFNAFMISGDYEQKLMNMSKASRLLKWEPRARPRSAER